MTSQVVHRKKKHSTKKTLSQLPPSTPHNTDNNLKDKIPINWLLLILALLITFFTYLPSLKNEFTTWDDNSYVINNPLVKQLNKNSIKEIFASENLKYRYWMGNYHPLTILSLAINYNTLQKNDKPVAWVFIFTNILLHIINTFLVFLLILNLSQKNWLAFVVALLFGIHTLHVESVSWISERKDVLYTMFYLWALLLYIRYVKKQKLHLYFLSIIVFLLSLLSKGQAVSLSLTIILIDIFYRRKLLSYTVIIEKIPFFTLSLIFGLIAIEAQKYSSALQIDQVYELYKRIGIASYGFAMYILKMILPIHLSAIYPYPDILNKTIPFYYYLFLIFDLFILFITYKWYKKGHYLAAFGIAFFVFNIIFLLQLIPVGSAIYADRYSYIPSIGFFLTIAYFWNKLFENKKQLAILLLSVFSITLIILTINREKVWRNSLSLWTDTTQKSPKAVVGWNNLGSIKAQIAKDSIKVNTNLSIDLYKQAVKDFSKAIEKKPDYANAFYNRGNAFFELARLTNDTSLITKALEDINKAIAIKVDFIDAFIQRGLIYDYINDLENAYINYKRVLMLSPNNTKALINLGIYFGKKELLDSAITYFNKAEKINPKLAEIYINRGLAYNLKKEYDKALTDLSIAIKLNPDRPAAYYNRAITYKNLKKYNKAIEDIDKAIELMPENSEFYYTKAIILEKLGKKTEACVYYQKSAKLNYMPAIKQFNLKCTTNQ